MTTATVAHKRARNLTPGDVVALANDWSSRDRGRPVLEVVRGPVVKVTFAPVAGLPDVVRYGRGSLVPVHVDHPVSLLAAAIPGVTIEAWERRSATAVAAGRIVTVEVADAPHRFTVVATSTDATRIELADGSSTTRLEVRGVSADTAIDAVRSAVSS